MDDSPENPSADTSELKCRGFIAGGEWPDGTLGRFLESLVEAI